MDFFEAQENARRRSARLVVFYLIAVILIVAGVYLAAVLILHLAAGEKPAPLEFWQPDLLAMVALGVLAVVSAGSLFKTASLKSGGGAVARMLGGRLVEPNTNRPGERRLVNVVEEMAIASGVRIPEIYVLPEEGINAFAAGFSADDAAVAVTEGCLSTLNRDQLQGVIAHEFSHILNGDMRLNIRLIGLLFGILLLAITGQILLRSTFFSGRRRDSKSGGIVLVVALIGVALILIGYIGVFFGRLIQSAVSRQREFLADASAVQFTRNPDGLAGALKRIGASQFGSVLKNNHATEASHLFFANGLRRSALDLFATHPPLTERIQAIDPSFKGDFNAMNPPASSLQRSEATDPSTKTSKSGAAAISRDQFLAQVGVMAGATLATTASALQSIPDKTRDLAHDPESARVLVLALLLDHDPAVRDHQLEAVTRILGKPVARQAAKIVGSTETFDREQRLTVLDLALPALKRLAVSVRVAFHQAVDELIVTNEDVSLFEFTVQQLLRRYVPIQGESGRPRVPDFYAIKPLAADIALVLATLADSAHHDDPDACAQAFQAGADRLDDVRSIPRPEITGLQAEKLAAALEHLSRASIPICKRILDACVQTAGFDGLIEPAEAELLRAISATLDCPIPPLQ